MNLPDFVRRQAQAESRHLSSLAAADHSFQEFFVAELGRKEVGSARAAAVMADIALGGVDGSARSDSVRLAGKGFVKASPA